MLKVKYLLASKQKSKSLGSPSPVFPNNATGSDCRQCPPPPWALQAAPMIEVHKSSLLEGVRHC